MRDLSFTLRRPFLTALSHGDETAPRKVLALHGWLDNAASFTPIVPHLGKGVHVVALDLSGHGLSDHRGAGAVHHFADWLVDVCHAVEALGWDKLTLLGHSMGAAVASLYAGAFPDKIEKFVALEGIAPLVSRAESAPDKMKLYLAAIATADKRIPIYKTEDDALKARMGAGTFAHEDGIRLVVKRGLQAVEGGWSWRADPRLRLPTAQYLTAEQAGAYLARIACPVRVVRARQGLDYDEKMWKALLSTLKQLSVVEMDGGHHVHLDAPAAVAEHVREFFA